MRVTMILNVGDKLGMVPGAWKVGKSWKSDDESRPLKETALLKSPTLQRIFLETCCHSNTRERPSANTGTKSEHKKDTKYIAENLIKEKSCEVTM